MTTGNNKRIAKNTVMLYIRMLFIMATSLYTSRVVLEILGIKDFGLYNIVGGVVVLFSFLNIAMSTATQRFLNFELGRDNLKEVQRIFSMSMTTHISIVLIVLLLSETIGLWFLNNYMNIPTDRMRAAYWVYQFSVLTTCFQIIRVPYNALIIAHEKMSFYAYISIIEVTLRLLIVFLLLVGDMDKLIFYSALTWIVSIIVYFLYKIYCNRNFSHSRYSLFWDVHLYKRLMSFSGWSLFGSIANVGAQQGINVLLNIFFGVAVNAAMGIANQVNQAVYSFTSNFQLAFNPQLVKSYSVGDRKYFIQLIFQTSKFSYFLLYTLSLPLLICCNFILHIWLETVPDYTTSFCRLMIVFSLIDAISAPLWMSVQATGRIRNYQLLMGALILANLPLTYLALKLGMNPQSALYIRVFINLLAFIIRIFYLKTNIDLPASMYIKEVILSSLLVTLLSLPVPLLLNACLDGWIGLGTTTSFSLVSTIALVYFVGLKRNEKQAIKEIIHTKILNRK